LIRFASRKRKPFTRFMEMLSPGFALASLFSYWDVPSFKRKTRKSEAFTGQRHIIWTIAVQINSNARGVTLISLGFWNDIRPF